MEIFFIISIPSVFIFMVLFLSFRQDQEDTRRFHERQKMLAMMPSITSSPKVKKYPSKIIVPENHRVSVSTSLDLSLEMVEVVSDLAEESSSKYHPIDDAPSVDYSSSSSWSDDSSSSYDSSSSSYDSSSYSDY